jgi:hypothetical protein
MIFGGTGFQPVSAQAEGLRRHFYGSGALYSAKSLPDNTDG